jgi:formylglycine-generating enzyme
MDLAPLRQFLMRYFDDDGLEDLCFDYFRDVRDEFTAGMTKGRKVRLLLDDCARNGRLPLLQAALRRERPAAYAAEVEPLERAPAPPPTAAARPHAPRNPRQVFVSHAHQDAELAQRLAADLEARGFAVWIAPDSIRPGEKWVEAISRGLDESGIFVVLLTEHAVASRWVRDETNVAIELRNEGLVDFVPLQLRACNLPALWRAYQRIPFRSYEAGLAQLLAALNDEPPPPPPARPPKPVSFDASIPSGDVWINPQDGAEYVRIPAGEFLYGEEKQRLHLDEFWMQKTPVTNAEFKRFIEAGGYANPDYWQEAAVAGRWQDGKYVDYGGSTRTQPVYWNDTKWNQPDHPVVGVSWWEALAYARWAGVRLPTEAQWEKAARGTDGRAYPWGDEWDPARVNTQESGIKQTTPVTRYAQKGASPYGVVDMAGNVWEWCSTRWGFSDPYTPDDGREGLRGGDDVLRVIRGGSWYLDETWARCAARLRNYPRSRDLNGGLGCCATSSLSSSGSGS